MEEELIKEFEKIEFWYDSARFDPGNFDLWDSVFSANDIFSEKLMHCSTKYPATLNYEFEELKERLIDIETSLDGKLRAYSWDDCTGGTMRFYEGLFQYETDEGVFACEVDSNRAYGVRKIISLDTNNLYLVFLRVIGSSIEIYDEARVFRIEKNSLNDKLALIETEEGFRNNIGYWFLYASKIEWAEDSELLTHYNKESKELTMRKVSADYEVLDEYDTWYFNGAFFEKKEK